MNRLQAILSLLAAFFGFFSPPVNAQVNLKIGYNISFMSSPGLDQIILKHNATQTYTSAFKKLRWMHGFEAGLRYKADIHAFELTYQSAYQALKAKGDMNGGAQPYTDLMKFGIQSAAFGYQISGEYFGIGTDLQYQWYTTRVELHSIEEKLKDHQKMLALKFYLMLTLPGNNGVDMAIQPYYILPFETYDLVPLSQYLQQEGNPGEEKWTRFGISLLFYNGGK